MGQITSSCSTRHCAKMDTRQPCTFKYCLERGFIKRKSVDIPPQSYLFYHRRDDNGGDCEYIRNLPRR